MKQLLVVLVVVVVGLVYGCSSGGNNPVSVEQPKADTSDVTHYNWGMWQFTADPAKQTLDVVQIRGGDMHLNALYFLEPPALVNLTLNSLHFNGNIIEADIGLKHPFLGLTEFSGFDVCGIFISDGTSGGFSDGSLHIAGDGDTRLLNPDGFTRWWNPREFPVDNGTFQSYQDGLLGTPYSIGNYHATLNGYKYYCDGLGPDDPLSAVPLAKRGLFSAGTKNVRHYTIQLGAQGLTFNYAVDACWKFPSGTPPYTAPDDFPPDANRPEAWRVDVTEVKNTLYNDGGSYGGELDLSLNVYDWFNGDSNTVQIEAPGVFDPMQSSTPTGSGDGYETYEFSIPDIVPPVGSFDILISVLSNSVGYGGLLPGKTVTGYFFYPVPVSPAPPNIIYVDDSNSSGTEDGSMTYPYSTIQAGIDAAPSGYIVLVDDSGNPYVENVEMKSDIILQSSNWDGSDGGDRALIDGPDEMGSLEYSVHFLNVDNATIEGFDIGSAGYYDAIAYTRMLRIDGGSDITVKDCFFTGLSDMFILQGIYAINSANLEIANCRFTDIEKDTEVDALYYLYPIYIDTCPNVVVRNNLIGNLEETPDTGIKNIDSITIQNTAGITIKNNLICNLTPESIGGSNFQKGIHPNNCSNIEIVNNTIDNLNVNIGFLNQCFAYFIETCASITFDNNIATRIYANGFPPPGARGVQGVGSLVTCDYTDVYDIGPGSTYGKDYYGTASPGAGAISSNPNYNDPGNYDYEFGATSPAQQGDPSFVDWDDGGSPSNDPGNTDIDTRSRMGCHGGPGGEVVGLLT